MVKFGLLLSAFTGTKRAEGRRTGRGRNVAMLPPAAFNADSESEVTDRCGRFGFGDDAVERFGVDSDAASCLGVEELRDFFTAMASKQQASGLATPNSDTK